MKIHQEVSIPATPARIYQILTSSREFAEFTAAPAEIASEEGGAFSCFGGMITGRHVELHANQSIVQAWRVYNWPAEIYSIVRIALEESGEATKVTLDHAGFPNGAEEHLEPGWHQNYWEPLKAYLESRPTTA